MGLEFRERNTAEKCYSFGCLIKLYRTRCLSFIENKAKTVSSIGILRRYNNTRNVCSNLLWIFYVRVLFCTTHLKFN